LSYGRGRNQPWKTTAGSINESGWFRFRFVNGTYDATGGLALGASMYVDPNVAVGLPNTITFAQPSDVGSSPSSRTFEISATASSGESVTFSSLTTTVCTVGSSTTVGGVSTATVTILPNRTGFCTITANSPYNNDYISAPSLTRSFSVVTPGPDAQLVITRAPVAGASGAVMSTTPRIEIRDAAGFTTSSSAPVTATIISGSGGVLAGATVNAVNGVATFSSLSLAGVLGTNYVLRFTSGSFSVDSETVTPSGPGVLTQLLLATPPGAAGPSATALGTQPVVELRDSAGNLATGSTAAVTVAIQSGAGGTLGGTTTVNAVNGVATFSGLTLAGVVGTSYVLRFTSGLLTIDSGN
ncbi:MAG: hypothetical protein ACK5RS_00005, partial [Acidobacteriota bacterium]